MWVSAQEKSTPGPRVLAKGNVRGSSFLSVPEQGARLAVVRALIL